MSSQTHNIPQATLAASQLLSLDADQMIGAQHGWLMDARDFARQNLESLDMPGVKDEQWRYTNLRAFKAKTFSPSEASDVVNFDFSHRSSPRLVLVNGIFDESLSDLAGLDDGVHFSALSTLLESEVDTNLAQTFGAALPNSDHQHSFMVHNTAYAQDGYVLSLDKNAVQQSPLEVYFLSTQPGAQAGEESAADQCAAHHYRNIIALEVNSQCTVIERHIGLDQSCYLNNSITEIQAQDNAHLDHYKLQEESELAFHFGGVFSQQGAGSNIKNHTVSLSGALTRNDLICDLTGQGAHVEMNGLVIGKAQQHIDNHTQVNHKVAHCTSDQYYKTILDDSSRSVFRGRIVVAQDAQQTSADQQNNNLLLSSSAEADTKPQLEIYADDVQCSHGATVGQLDPKSIYYLNSRGIDPESARALLTFAFANEVVERIKVDAIREELTQRIAGELLQGLEDLV